MMNPKRAYISGPRSEDVEGVMLDEPRVGNPMQLFLDDGKLMRTSPVLHVSRDQNELVVDTLNSRYRVTLMAAA
jgi:hypothetical protein